MIHTGGPHPRAYLTGLTTGVSHGRIPVEPKLSPIRKRPILRVLRHYKTYKYTLEEEERGCQGGGSRELLKESRLIHLRSRIHHQD
ncbi:Minor capsid VP2 [Gossypium arboreum]|uniref:Minor capsid VP2 n=1 Tax=Gossypium arboreum TaxID=29729 RepID=A0A0B0P2Z1_GOSAR|nr:Minor capsid VP2 [Gossypium arboreum]